MKYLTKENVTLIIAILGFILSVSQWIYTLWSKRTHFNAEIKNISKTTLKGENTYIFSLLINNLSSAPLVITKVTTQNIDCKYTKKWISERYFPKFPETDIPITERVFSSQLPLNFAPHSASLELLVFKIPNGEKLNLASPITITFTTTNKIKTLKLKTPNNTESFLKL